MPRPQAQGKVAASVPILNVYPPSGEMARDATLTVPEPVPLLRVWRTFRTEDGAEIRFVGERWDAGDRERLPFETTADPYHPGYAFSVRAYDALTGKPLTELFDDPGAAGEGYPRPFEAGESA